MTQNKKYDLEERTALFGENIIRLCKGLPQTPITRPLITQLVKAATSIGANYSEADDAESPKDFKHKIGIVKKEARECKHFLRMLITATPSKKEAIQSLWQEAKEINLIFNAIFRKLK
jgi:four helix bundle protein